MENRKLKKRTQAKPLLVEGLSKDSLMKAADKCAVLIILSPFLYESWVVFFLKLHFVYFNNENKQNVWANLTHRTIVFPCVSGRQDNQHPAAVSYQVKLLDRNENSALPVVVSTGTTNSKNLDPLIMTCFRLAPENSLFLSPTCSFNFFPECI